VFALLKILLLVCGGTYLFFVLFMFLTQRSAVFQPVAEHVTDPAAYQMEYSDQFLTNRLGTRIHAWHLRYPGASRTVLFCHGNAGNVSHRMETLKLFRELGVSVLIFDYSGYGKSAGRPSEKATEADARAAWDYLMESGVAPDEVIIFGRSIGGGVAVSLAAELAREGVAPAGLVLESTFTSMVDVGKSHYPWLPISLLSRYRYESATKAEALDVPTLVIHSRDDEIVPWTLGRGLYDALPGDPSFLEIHGSHNSGYMDSRDVYLQGLSKFLQEIDADSH